MVVIPGMSVTVVLWLILLCAFPHDVTAQDSAAIAAVDSTSAESAIISLSREARNGPLKLAALRGLPLDDPRTFAMTLPVPPTWTCRMRLDERLVNVRCDILVPTGMAQAEYERLEKLLFDHGDRRAWARDALAAQEMMRRSTGMERAVAYFYRRQRRVIARMSLSIGTGALNARVPRGSDRIIVLSVTSFPRAD